MTRVLIGVPTYRRPAPLAMLLASLQAQRLQGDLDVQILVADNDPEGSAANTVKQFAERSVPCDYSTFTTRGIGAIRSYLFAEALHRGVDYIAFIDDDEIPEPLWLARLIATARETGADAVVGPVIPITDTATPSWATQSSLFRRPRHATGSPVRTGGMGNALISARMVAAYHPSPFPAPLSAAGEDTFFFLRGTRDGWRLVWCDDALVYEVVPRARTRFRWMVHRAFYNGRVLAISESAIDGSLRSLTRRALVSTAQLAHIGLIPMRLSRGRLAALECLLLGSKGLGGWTGILRRRLRS